MCGDGGTDWCAESVSIVVVSECIGSSLEVRASGRAAEREALLELWEASDRICGKWLKAVVPVVIEAMLRHGVRSVYPESGGHRFMLAV